MLTNDAMGILALAILWVNTLLITAAAGKELRALLGRRRVMKSLGAGEEGVGLIEGRVIRADGPGGALACHNVEQVGRQGSTRGERRTILFADRSQNGEVFGGAVTLGNGATQVDVQCAREAEVWLPGELLQKAGACPSPEAFDEAYEAARKARGYARTVTAPIGAGAHVWVIGQLERTAEGLRMGPISSESGEAGKGPGARIQGGILVTALDPRRFCTRKVALTVSFMLAVPAIAAACTALALYPPHFGTVSTAGGVLCLVFFLLVQPAGTALRDAVLPPNRSEARGRWARDELAPPALR